MFEFERAISLPYLWAAWEKVNGNHSKSAGVDKIDLDYYGDNAEENISVLRYSLHSGCYEPYREKEFVSRKNRKIYISCLEDKIVQSAVAKVIYETAPANSAVHGFIKNRSIYTAHTALERSIGNNVIDYFKADISHFYESVSIDRIMDKLKVMIGDIRFIDLVGKLLSSHVHGLSTGSALSPVLSNIYLAEFDKNRQENTGFYARYVDDMLLAPACGMPMGNLIANTGDELTKIGLTLNPDKSIVVDAKQGFTYLGFDIKAKNKMVDDFIAKGNFFDADKLLNLPVALEDNPDTDDTIDGQIVAEENPDSDDTTDEQLPTKENPNTDDTNDRKIAVEENLATEETFNSQITTEENPDADDTTDRQIATEESPDPHDIPAHISAVAKKCHIVRQMIQKASSEHHLGFPEKQTLLHIFHCLGEDGQEYLHSVLSNCTDYNYAVTQGYIDRCRSCYPLGCKKLCERFEGIYDKSECTCNFSNDKMYPSPVVHAIRRKPGCVTLPSKKDQIGHFKQLPFKQSAEDTVSRILDLNKQEYEIAAQQKICTGQLESLFARNDIAEIKTPMGLLIKSDDGFFIKVG